MKWESLVVFIDEKYIGDIICFLVKEVYDFFESFSLFEKDMKIVDMILCEICECLSFFINVGFDYLILNCFVGIFLGGEV